MKRPPKTKDEMLRMLAEDRKRYGLDHPEIGVELVRFNRLLREAFARRGYHGDPRLAPPEMQRAVDAEMRRELRPRGPRKPELKPGQFERDLILYATGCHADRAHRDRAIAELAKRWGEKFGTLRNRYYKLAGETPVTKNR